MTKVKLIEASVVELKPGHKYIIAVDDAMLSNEDAVSVTKYLSDIGIEDVIVAMFHGDPNNGLRVIEDPRGGVARSA
jgi:hypothetical protein